MFRPVADYFNLHINYEYGRSLEYVQKKIKNNEIKCFDFKLKQVCWPCEMKGMYIECELVSGIMREKEHLYGPASLRVNGNIVYTCDQMSNSMSIHLLQRHGLCELLQFVRYHVL